MGNTCSSDCVVGETEQLDITVEPPRLEIGDEVLACGGKGFTNAQGVEIYRDGDKGKIRKFFKHDQTGESRVKILWTRTGMTTTFPISKWQQRFQVIRKLSKLLPDANNGKQEESMTAENPRPGGVMKSANDAVSRSMDAVESTDEPGSCSVAPASSSASDAADVQASEPALDANSGKEKPSAIQTDLPQQNQKEEVARPAGPAEEFLIHTIAPPADITTIPLVCLDSVETPLVTMDEPAPEASAVAPEAPLVEEERSIVIVEPAAVVQPAQEAASAPSQAVDLLQEAVPTEKVSSAEDAMYPCLLNSGADAEAKSKAADADSSSDLLQSLAATDLQKAEASETEAIARKCVDTLDDLLCADPAENGAKLVDIVDTSLWNPAPDGKVSCTAADKMDGVEPAKSCPVAAGTVVESDPVIEAPFADILKLAMPEATLLADVRAAPMQLPEQWHLQPSVGTWLRHGNTHAALEAIR